jgi:hypothetical protein
MFTVPPAIALSVFLRVSDSNKAASADTKDFAKTAMRYEHAKALVFLAMGLAARPVERCGDNGGDVAANV